jgi:phosphoesterase RecJ-like protein
VSIQELLKSFDKFLITTHKGIDGDAVGSCLAMGHFLSSRGKDVLLFFQDSFPQKYLPLLGSLKIVPDVSPEASGSALICLDTSDLERAEIRESSNFAHVVNIDHHPTNTNFGSWNVVHYEYSSTGEILAEMLLNEGFSAPKIVWDSLYLAIYADTNGFQFQNTRPQTLKIAAEVLSRGSGPEISSLFFSLSEEELRILARALDNMVFEPPIAYSVLHHSLNLPEGFDSDYIMNIWKNWREPKVYLLFKEIHPKFFKVSMRANPGIDLTRVAVQFNGGGHAAAAGCTVHGDWEEARRKLTEAIRNEILRS